MGFSFRKFVKRPFGSGKSLTDPKKWLNAATLGSSGLIADSAGLMPGGKRDYIFGGAAAHTAADAAKAERAAAERSKKQQDDLVNEIRIRYGMAPAPIVAGGGGKLKGFAARFADTAPNAGTVLNKEQVDRANVYGQHLGQSRGRLIQSAYEQGQQGAEDTAGGDIAQARVEAARSGTMTSGNYIRNRGRILQNYYNNLAGARTNATQTGQNFDNQMTQDRAKLEDMARSNKVVDTSGMLYDAAVLGQLGTVGGFASNLIARTAPQAASIYTNDRLMRAYG